MKSIDRLKSLFSGIQDPRSKSIMSRRFIIAIAAIYSTLILAVAVLFYVTIHINAATLRDAIESNARDIFLERTELIVSRMQAAGLHTSDAVARELKEYNESTGRLVAAFIFTKTADENYFRTDQALLFHDNFRPGLARSSVVREGKKVNYLKNGLVHGVVDPAIYQLDGYCWQNTYYPYGLGKKKAVIQLMISATSVRDILDNYDGDTRGTRTFLIILTVLLVLAVIILSAVFVQNYSLLIGNLSSFMDKAAGGDLDISLHQSGDGELNQLALSFNTLIEEMKDLSTRPATEAGAPQTAQDAAPAADSDETGTLFTSGVALLKDNKLDDAIAIFRTLTIIKPQGFGSWFNLGVAHAKKRDYERAIVMFEEARRLNPGFDVTTQYIDKIRRLMAPDD